MKTETKNCAKKIVLILDLISKTFQLNKLSPFSQLILSKHFGSLVVVTLPLYISALREKDSIGFYNFIA